MILLCLSHIENERNLSSNCQTHTLKKFLHPLRPMNGNYYNIIMTDVQKICYSAISSILWDLAPQSAAIFISSKCICIWPAITQQLFFPSLSLINTYILLNIFVILIPHLTTIASALLFLTVISGYSATDLYITTLYLSEIFPLLH